jgi:hypothetical protein
VQIICMANSGRFVNGFFSTYKLYFDKVPN